jgi:hypothetical protein
VKLKLSNGMAEFTFRLKGGRWIVRKPIIHRTANDAKARAWVALVMRLRRRGARLLEAMSEQPTTYVRALAEDRNEALAFGRFLDHSSVSHGEMLTATGKFTGQRAAGRHVLAIQELTTHAVTTAEQARQIVLCYHRR